MWNDFHFLRPEWLWALPFVLLFLIVLLKRNKQKSGWETICDPELLHFQLTQYGSPIKKSFPLYHWTMPFLLFITLIALAGPSWEKKEQPIFQQGHALVIIMDLSQSMSATDIKPSRLERSKLKLTDILKQKKEGQTALIAFAGDAHIVSPLTIDNKTIISLLPALNPEIMPLPGSHLIDALNTAQQLFKNAGFAQGDILLITDGIDSSQKSTLKTAIKSLNQQGYQLSIIGVGSQTGSPIPLPDQAGFVKDQSGQVVLSKLVEKPLIELTHLGRGHYQKLSLDDRDFERLLNKRHDLGKTTLEQDNQIEQWYDEGAYLSLLLIPLALLSFRKGLFSLFLLVLLSPYFMMESASAEEMNRWEQLWSTPDQQAQKAFRTSDYTQAAERFTDKDWQASAHYKAGNFEQALKHYEQFNDANNLYNKANTLANLQQFEQAKEAYEEALKKQPDLNDAQKNLDYVDEILKQQKQEQQEQQEQQKQDQENSDQSDDNKENSDDQKQDKKSNSDEQSSQENKSDSQESDTDQQDESSQKNDEQSEQAKSPEDSQAKEPQESNSPEKNTQEEKEAQAKKQASEKDNEEQQEATGKTSPEDVLSQLSPEEQQSLKQWLQRIPDNPGRLLKIKFRNNTLLKQKNTDTENQYEGDPW